MFTFRAVTVNDNGLTVRYFFGLSRKIFFPWDNVERVNIVERNFKYHRFLTHKNLTLYYKDFSAQRINVSGMLWFERKKLMKEIEKHAFVKKDPPMPKFWDLM